MAECLQVSCSKGKFVVKNPKELAGCSVDYRISGRKRVWFLVSQEKPFSSKQKEIAKKYDILLPLE